MHVVYLNIYVNIELFVLIGVEISINITGVDIQILPVSLTSNVIDDGHQAKYVMFNEFSDCPAKSNTYNKVKL